MRDTPKKHGLKHLIENQPPAGTRVLVLDDVVTSGGSLLRAAAAARDAGCNVVGAMALVDREAGGAERIREESRPLRPGVHEERVPDRRLTVRSTRADSYPARSNPPARRRARSKVYVVEAPARAAEAPIR